MCDWMIIDEEWNEMDEEFFGSLTFFDLPF